MGISERLKNARVAANMNQEQLASIIGVAKSTLSGYELGTREPSMSTIAKITAALNVDANYLLQDEMNAATGNHLSDDEKTLVDYSRRLNDENRSKLLRYACGLLDVQEGEEILRRADEAKETAETA